MATIIQTLDGVVVNKFELGDTALKFGRTGDNQVQIENPEVSNEHAQIIRETKDEGDVAYFLVDLDSTNGTYVNGHQIDKHELMHKDNIRIGLNIFTFIDENKVDIERTSEIKKSWIPGIYYSK